MSAGLLGKLTVMTADFLPDVAEEILLAIAFPSLEGG